MWYQVIGTSQNSILNFKKKKNQIFESFHAVVHVKTFPLMYQLLMYRVILTKLRWFQLFVASQNSNFELYWKKKKKKINCFGFPWCSTREDLSIDASITNVGLILTKPGLFLFSGYGQMDRHSFGILTWKHVGTQKISTENSKLVVSCRSLYASPEVGDAQLLPINPICARILFSPFFVT